MMKDHLTSLFVALALGTVSATASAIVVDVDIDDDGLIEIDSLEDLNEMRNDLAGTSLYGVSTGCDTPCFGYELVADLDFDTNQDGAITEEDDYWNGGLGWQPVGSFDDEPFTAYFDGNFHSIRNLYINRPTEDYVGLFGTVMLHPDHDTGVHRVRIKGPLTHIRGNTYVGIVGGYIKGSPSPAMSYVSSAGLVEGQDAVGGLVGDANGGIWRTFSQATVNANWGAGGLAGELYDALSESYAQGSVTASACAAGLAGGGNGQITDSYATGSVQASMDPGGLTACGTFTVDNSYWASDTTGQTVSIGGGLALTSTELRCPTAPADTTCSDGDTLYPALSAGAWDFGTSDDYPALIFNGHTPRDDDNDGEDNDTDAFPENPAASLDSDGDGRPDAWHPNCDSACQDASGLVLDTVPTDPAPTADAGGPYAASSGDTLILDASGSTDNGTIVSYEWDINNDGSIDLTGVMPTVSIEYGHEETRIIDIRLLVTDDAGGTDEDVVTATLEIERGKGRGDEEDRGDDGGSPSGVLLALLVAIGSLRRTALRRKAVTSLPAF